MIHISYKHSGTGVPGQTSPIKVLFDGIIIGEIVKEDTHYSFDHFSKGRLISRVTTIGRIQEHIESSPFIYFNFDTSTYVKMK